LKDNLTELVSYQYNLGMGQPKEAQIAHILTYTLCGRVLKLVTLCTRPPVVQITLVEENVIELHYSTGEVERAHRTNSDLPDSFLLSRLVDETLGGEKPLIAPFVWNS
jgi:hypothetical protein